MFTEVSDIGLETDCLTWKWVWTVENNNMDKKTESLVIITAVTVMVLRAVVMTILMIINIVIRVQLVSLHGVVHVSVCAIWPKHSNPALHERDRFLFPTPHVPGPVDQDDHSLKLSRI